MIILNRVFSNYTLLLNFTRSTVFSTRCYFDIKSILKNNQQKKKGEEKDKKEQIFSLLVDDDKKADAKKKLCLLRETVIKQNQDNSVGQSLRSTLNKIEVSLPQKITEKKKEKKHKYKLLHELMHSVDDVAKEFPKDYEQTKSDLLKKLEDLKYFEMDKATQPHFEKSSKAKELLLSIDVIEKQSLKRKSLGFTDEDLGIFPHDFQASQENEVKLKIWDELQKEELKLMFLAAPRNYFEELIHWTEQGKLWHFPIDNEQGLEDEAKVDFTEHVFLEEHLEPWCPKTGPLRHFMELVICGLSKNPYLKVSDKHEQIYWFRDYFENKKKLLLNLGAFETKLNVDK